IELHVPGVEIAPGGEQDLVREKMLHLAAEPVVDVVVAADASALGHDAEEPRALLPGELKRLRFDFIRRLGFAGRARRPARFRHRLIAAYPARNSCLDRVHRLDPLLVGAFAGIGQSAELETADRSRDAPADPPLLDPHNAGTAVHLDRTAGEVLELQAEPHQLRRFERHVGDKVDPARTYVACDGFAAPFQLDRELAVEPFFFTSLHSCLAQSGLAPWPT